MKKNCRIFIFLFFFTHFVWAKNELFVLVGGGEPEGQETIFDRGTQSFADIAKTYEDRWNSKFLVQQQHDSLKNIVKDLPHDEFNRALAEKEIKSLIEKMKTMKPGESVAVVILTHGIPAKKSDPTGTHFISATPNDKSRTDDRDDVNMDLLIDVAKVAKERSLKLAIVDNSCYSGGTQNITKLAQSKDICILTAASKYIPTYSNYITDLSDSLKNSVNFESAYLETRKRHVPNGHSIENHIYSITPSLPEISGPTGDFLSHYFFPKLIHYITDARDKMDPDIQPLSNKVEGLKKSHFYNFVVDQITKQTQTLSGKPANPQSKTEAISACPDCDTDNVNIDQTRNFLNHLKISIAPDQEQLLNKFERDLKEYSSLIKKYKDHIENMTDKISSFEHTKYQITSPHCKKSNTSYDKQLSISAAQDFVNDYKKGLFPQFQSCEKDILKNLELAQKSRNSAKQQLDLDMLELQKTLLNLNSQLSKLTDAIYHTEKILYDETYHYFLKTAGSSGSPCSDFHW